MSILDSFELLGTAVLTIKQTDNLNNIFECQITFYWANIIQTLSINPKLNILHIGFSKQNDCCCISMLGHLILCIFIRECMTHVVFNQVIYSKIENCC